MSWNNAYEKRKFEEKQKKIMYEFPNIPSETTPIGKDDSENVEIRKWGEPRNFDFEAKAHWDIGANLVPVTLAAVSGSRIPRSAPISQ